MWFNPIMCWLARSPFHFFISNSIMLMTYEGRKSGQLYTTPMNYLEIGNTLYTISLRERVWWRNLGSGADVSLRLHGREVAARSEAVLEADQVARDLQLIVTAAPRMAKYIGINLDPAGLPDLDDVNRQAQDRVIIRTRLV